MSGKGGLQSCLVVGAGIAGLCAARSLAHRGIEVVVVDKGRGVGGRCATRRIEGAVVDHGAQFFTARDDRFSSIVGELLGAGAAREWCTGFPDVKGGAPPEKLPHYCGTAGMSQIARHLAAGLDVRTGVRAAAVRFAGGRWEAQTGGGIISADAVVMTPPVPQSLELLRSGGVELPERERRALERIVYEPCIAVLILLDGPSHVPPPGGVRLSGEPLAWIADSTLKGISPQENAVTVHAGAKFSRQRLESNLDETGRTVLEAASPWIGSVVRTFQVHRWRYSKPVVLHGEPCLVVQNPGVLVFAGDAFAGPRVEGAALSGLAAASSLIGRRIP